MIYHVPMNKVVGSTGMNNLLRHPWTVLLVQQPCSNMISVIVNQRLLSQQRCSIVRYFCACNTWLAYTIHNNNPITTTRTYYPTATTRTFYEAVQQSFATINYKMAVMFFMFHNIATRRRFTNLWDVQFQWCALTSHAVTTTRTYPTATTRSFYEAVQQSFATINYY